METNRDSEQPDRPSRPSARPVALIVLDGWGIAPPGPGNAVSLARTPVVDRALRQCPNTTLLASGAAVGLPDGQIGNSEVGHLTIGAGRIVPMDLPRIDAALARGELASNPALRRLIARTKAAGGAVHLAGLASDGGVHSHMRHIEAFASCVEDAGLPLRLHVFLDGRDVLPGTAAGFLRALSDRASHSADCRIATVSGRYFAMDRDRRWDRTEAAWRCVARGVGVRAGAPAEVAATLDERTESEEFLPPTVLDGHDGIRPRDGFLSANFRVDRMRQLLAAVALPDFDAFDTGGFVPPGAMAAATPLSEELDRRIEPLFPAQRVEATLGRHLSRTGLTQLRIAETEKYPHVTYFLNGGVEPPDPGEERFLAPSPKVATYDLAPEMSARAVADRLIGAALARECDFVAANFANPDMVGHTGDLDAVVRAVETVDRELGRVLDAVREVGGVAVVTADHGNAERMLDPDTGRPHTAHTTNPVPFALVGYPGPGPGLARGGLRDVAPTVLELLGVAAPPQMTGRSLLARPHEPAP